MKYILVSNVFTRKSFDIVSILKKEFPQDKILLATSTFSFWNKCLSFLFCGHVKMVRLRSNHYDNFEKDIKDISNQYKGHSIIYLPIEEETTAWFIDLVERNKFDNFRYLLPSSHWFYIFRNKEKLGEYCIKESFPAPLLYNLSNIPDSAYPLLLKPSIGSGSRGLIRLYSPTDFSDDIRQVIQKESYIAEELLPNGKDVHGAFFLCNEGKVISAYTHKRIRTAPEEGGVTVLSQMSYNIRLIEQGTKLLEKVSWNGLIMLEYLYDTRCDKYKLIEANPRLWGSIMLSEYGGAYLMMNYIRLCLGKSCKSQHINNECYIRWLFPMDIVNYIKKRGNLKSFWKFGNTCFINWSYARKDRAFFFILYSIFNLRNLKKFLKRL